MANIMDLRSTRFIQSKVIPLFRKNDFKAALLEIRKEMEYRSTADLKDIEIMALYGGKKYDEAIKKGNEYLKTMHNGFEKATIAGSLSLIEQELGNKAEEIKYINIAIGIYKKILCNRKKNYQDKNRARLQLIYKYRLLGDYKNALQIAKIMERELLDKNNEQALMGLIPLYSELSKIYKALSNSLMKKYYPESYKKMNSGKSE